MNSNVAVVNPPESQSRSALAPNPRDADESIRGVNAAGARLLRIRKFCDRPMVLLAVLLAAHLGMRIGLHRVSPLSGSHNYDRTYGVSLSLMAGRGFHDIALDESAASAPIQEFCDLKRSQISREEFAAYVASKPDTARDPYYDRFFALASIRVLDVRLAALLWSIFGIDRQVLAVFYSLFSTAACACVFLIARKLTGSGWAGLAAAGLMTLSPIEAFLNTWSWRDVSPMWFTAFSLAWFAWALDRWRRPSANAASYLVLGILAVAGIGWRIDSLLLAPFLAGCVAVRLIAARRGWRQSIVCAACFVAAALGTRGAIMSLGPQQIQTPSIGFHMAVYSDFPRSKLLGIENTFQAMFSDMQTVDYVRQVYRADYPDRERPQYLSPQYCDLCRAMFLEQMNYNLFNWIYRFPRFYFRCLAGLDTQSMIGEIGSRQIQQGLQSPLLQCFRCGDRLGHTMPWLFFAGVLATLGAGRRRLTAMLVLLFSVYYAGIMFLVLPDQKHLGVFLVPLYTFAGAGVWAIARLFVRATWRKIAKMEWLAPVRQMAVAGAAVAVMWGLACIAARAHSVAKREELLQAIEARAIYGVDAPETLRGERNFTVAIRPDNGEDASGFLLKISAGDKPGLLVCRQIYFPRDWAHLWGRELITRHKLSPNREQSFFVSCLHGPKLGDPCPHTCTVEIDGGARIMRCTRVGMADWNHAQIATLFYDGQRSPGSPPADASSTDWLYVGCRTFSDPSPDRVLSNRGGMLDIMAPVPPPNSAGRPLQHLIARSGENGLWRIARSDGWRFSFGELTYWSPAMNWSQILLGDFNGDGMTDLVEQAVDGRWWLAKANGGFHDFQRLDALPSDKRFDYAAVGDFNGDRMDDLILRSTDGRWTLAVSRGASFHCMSIDGLPGAANPQDIVIGDFLGKGRSQIAALDPHSGRWTIAGFDGQRWWVRPWGDFPPNIDWRNLIAADFCGSGRTDVAAWNPATGDWTLGRDDGDRLIERRFGNWPTGKQWSCVQAGRFGDGRRVGLAGLDAGSHQIAIAACDGQQFHTRYYSAIAAMDKQMIVGTFSGGPRDELLAVAADRTIWVGKLDADGELHFASWGRWPNREPLSDFHSLDCWPGCEPIR